MDILPVELRPLEFPPNAKYKTGLWISRKAKHDDEDFVKRSRPVSVMLWNKLEACCRAGLSLYEGGKGAFVKHESSFTGVFRIGFPTKSNYRFLGFYEQGTEGSKVSFIIVEVYLKPGDLGVLGRDTFGEGAEDPGDRNLGEGDK